MSNLELELFIVAAITAAATAFLAAATFLLAAITQYIANKQRNYERELDKKNRAELQDSFIRQENIRFLKSIEQNLINIKIKKLSFKKSSIEYKQLYAYEKYYFKEIEEAQKIIPEKDQEKLISFNQYSDFLKELEKD